MRVITGEAAEGLEGNCVSWIPREGSSHELRAATLANKQKNKILHRIKQVNILVQRRDGLMSPTPTKEL